MRKEVKAQEKVGVGIEVLWKAVAKDLRFVIPKVVPNLVKDAQVIEGDGGIGTVLLFNFGTGVSTIKYQKEKIVELDEHLHIIGLQVIEGGHLNHGFSSYKTTFQLTAITEDETLIDVMVVYESEAADSAMPAKTMQSALAYIKCLENYLLNCVS